MHHVGNLPRIFLECSVLLGCDAVSLCNRFPTFRRKALPSSLGTQNFENRFFNHPVLKIVKRTTLYLNADCLHFDLLDVLLHFASSPYCVIFIHEFFFIVKERVGMRALLFWVTQSRLIITDVSGQPISPISRSQAVE